MKVIIIAAFLMVAALTGILSIATSHADIKSPKKAHDTSNTNVEQHSKLSIVASGLNLELQNCLQNNIDSQITAGDEQLDCQNENNSGLSQNASD
jgi:hypothetical protein